MPGITLQTDALVLLKQPPADAFQNFTVFSAEHGVLAVLQRVAKKNASTSVPLDLFDEAALSLESSNQGRTWFLREARLLSRQTGIGRRYETLRLASALTTLIARNPVPDESRSSVAALLRTAFAAFADAEHPELVYFKSLYCFARDEGYPLKQDWLPRLSAAQRAAAADVLNQPLTAQTTAAGVVTQLTHQLENYLRAHTDILLEE
ncbi:MAG: hypothetical protein KGJ37_01990 [Verrucomicrobiota bacterium]|nr:hypothetical protein [Verrucomicrobiota bacterium]